MQLVVIAHNIRSCLNVGSTFRSCEGFGVTRLYLTGYTPHPRYEGDERLPHIASKLEAQINKTALGAEQLVPFTHREDVQTVVRDLRHDGYDIIGLEQVASSVPIALFSAPEKCVLILGEGVAGMPADIQTLCDAFVEIPMKGQKESLNVSVATGIALYALSTHSSQMPQFRASPT